MANAKPSSETSWVVTWPMVKQFALAALLALPTVMAFHLIAFGLSNLWELFGRNAGNFFYMVGEGIAASVCLGFFLMRVRASSNTKAWCWIAGTLLWCGAMPAWGILLGEGVHMMLLVMLLATSFLMWLVWLPFWRATWMVDPAEISNHKKEVPNK